MLAGQLGFRAVLQSLVPVALTILTGCTTVADVAEGPRSENQAANDCASPRTIDDYCAARSCPSFDEAAASARKMPEPGALYRYAIGTCGSYRFIRTQEGMGMGTDYFDAQGKLVATTSVADAPRCNGEFASMLGAVPKCEEKVLEHDDASVK